ncbi:MAG: orotidine 5'-phosphate decarboxylase / HUMPS family protein, partial [Candidatus Omnitrophota bacterium]
MSNSWEKLIVALDLEDKDKIIKVVEALSGRGVKFKIGSIAFTKFGPRFLSDIIKEKVDVF